MDIEVDAVLDRIRKVRSFDFRNYKRATLRRRIERRMVERSCETVADYNALLERDPAEFDALISSMLIKVTSFFRDPEMWEELAEKVIPQLLVDKRDGEELRVWSAGCATGEEAYSLAILLAEAMGTAYPDQELKIFGTDVDQAAIAAARRGVYPSSGMQAVSAERRKRWFIQEGTDWSVRKEIRRSVVFGVNNLVDDAPISRLDLLLCRNVFIYLDTQLQKRVLTRFHYGLRRHGVLVLGKSELIPFAARIYQPLDLARRIYCKDSQSQPAVWQDQLAPMASQDSSRRPELPADAGPLLPFHRDVLQSLPLPMVATALDGTILFWNAAAAALWSRSEAETAGKTLAALNLAGLSGEALVEQSQQVRDGRVDRAECLGSFTRQGSELGQRLRVAIVPLRDGKGGVTGLLYTLQDVTSLVEAETELRTVNEQRQSALEELRTTNEEMQSSNEELETTNEELQSSNEELQTTNEELQSTNEELETTNEELQSTNAELDATNRELAHRTEEMNRLSFYQRTIIRSLSAAVIVVDAEARITLWNLAAERLLGLTENEALGQVLWTLHVPALGRPVMQRVRKSLANKLGLRLDDVEYRLPTGGAGRATVVAVPIVEGGAPHGAVILFEDGTRTASLATELARLKGKKSRAQAKES